MKSKAHRSKPRRQPSLPEDWSLPALVDRRNKLRPARETARQKTLGAARRKPKP